MVNKLQKQAAEDLEKFVEQLKSRFLRYSASEEEVFEGYLEE